MMKNLRLLFMATALLAFFSCSNDEEWNQPEEFMGTWNLEEMNYTAVSSVSAYGETSTTTTVGEGRDLDVIIEFQQNPNGYHTSGSYIIDMKVDYGGMDDVFDSDFFGIDREEMFPSEVSYRLEGFMQSGDWEIVGDNVIRVHAEGSEPSEAIIREITDRILIMDFDHITETNQGEMKTTNEIQGTYTFVR
ncbi:hypothetical protein KIH41_15940 [Litoribacter ruber]|uniref:Lipocalin-like domain-containing protein n=1 Tax=Litoribacter ruber TaxID=702568 RepID=A0AAP2G227_9BACT|nr:MULTISPECIES: hypothetical protein [Litoribacter]MBS9525529.1 hypothetical protein [Litoribacter alkaliphilus]MBT0812778.1 hypothetical protein [Litoribacter ruber]